MKRFLLMAFAALMFVGAQAKNAPEAKKQIGLATYSVKGIDSDPDRAFKEIAEMGYTDIEISNFNQQQGTAFGKKPAEFKKYLESFGLKLVSSHSSAGVDLNDEAGVLKKWDALFAAHKEMGVKYVVFPMNMSWGNEETVKKIAAQMNKIGELASNYGISFLYHNHNMEFTKAEGSDKMIEEILMENTDPRYVNFQLDVYWCYQGKQNPVEWLTKHADRIKVLHIKDYYVIGASGKINYEAIFNQFYKNGYEDFFVEMENETTIEQADQQAERMFSGNMFGGARPQGQPQGQPQARPQGQPQGQGQARPQGAPQGRPQQDPAQQTAQLDKALKGVADSFKFLNAASFVD